MTAVTKPTDTKLALVRVVQERADQIAPFLPAGRSLDQVGHALQMLAIKNPDLLHAVPSQLVVAITRGLRAGLEIGEEWHLLTFKNKDLTAKHGRDIFDVVGTADYKALAQMVIASGFVRYLDPQCVYQGDEFSFALGLEKHLRHVPAPSGKRGRLIGAYVILTLPFGVKEFFYMPLEAIETIRARSKSWSKGDCPPWYAMKCAIRQAVKLLPKDRRLAKALGAIEQDEAAETVQADATMERPAHVTEDGEDLSYETDEDLLAQDRELHEREG